MQINSIKSFAIGVLAFLALTTSIRSGAQDSNHLPAIPRTWDDEAMRSAEIPLASPEASPKYVSSDYYYRMPVRPIYKSYPVYRPGKEPAAYMDWLKAQVPQVIFDASKLKTEQDWINAGEIVFDAAIEYESSGQLFLGVRDAAWYDKNGVPTTKDGILPNMRYVVREKGKVELGTLSCAMCHSRVMPDGSVIKGAQGNYPDDHAFGYEIRQDAAQAKDKDELLKDIRKFMRRSYAAPWLDNDPNGQPDRMTLQEIASVMEAIVPGRSFVSTFTEI